MPSGKWDHRAVMSSAWSSNDQGRYLQKPPQLLRYPLHLPLLPHPQRHRRLPRLEPELHDHLAAHGHPIQPRPQFLSAGVVQGEDTALVVVPQEFLP